MKLTHGIAAVQGRAADLCAGKPLCIFYSNAKIISLLWLISTEVPRSLTDSSHAHTTDLI